MIHHHLHVGETCHGGFFEARLKPILTIDSGDEATSTPSVAPRMSYLKKQNFTCNLNRLRCTPGSDRMVPGHILTGAIAVKSPETGYVLELDTLEVKLRTGATT